MFRTPWWINRRLISVLVLGFSSGLPLGLIGSTLQAWFTISGASLVTIGWLTLVGQPYAFKFIWAPLLDQFSLTKLGRRRSWIIAMQIGLGASLLVMSFGHPNAMPISVCILAFLTALFSATQDTAIDAYRTELLTEKEQGLGVAMNTVAYRAAMIVSTSLALIFAATLGWRMMYFSMGFMFFVLAVVSLCMPNTNEECRAQQSVFEAFVSPCKELMQRKKIGWILIFIVLYKLCDAMALSLNTTFLIRGVGFSLVEIGTVSKLVGLSAALFGSFIGGLLLPRLGLYRALWQFGLLQTFSNLGYAWLGWHGKSMIGMAATVFGEYFCGGLATVAFIVLLMQLCDRRYTASQYALFSAAASLGRIFIGPISAVVVKQVGWIDFYIISSFVGLPALMILYGLNQSRSIEYSASKP